MGQIKVTNSKSTANLVKTLSVETLTLQKAKDYIANTTKEFWIDADQINQDPGYQLNQAIFTELSPNSYSTVTDKDDANHTNGIYKEVYLRRDGNNQKYIEVGNSAGGWAFLFSQLALDNVFGNSQTEFTIYFFGAHGANGGGGIQIAKHNANINERGLQYGANTFGFYFLLMQNPEGTNRLQRLDSNFDSYNVLKTFSGHYKYNQNPSIRTSKNKGGVIDPDNGDGVNGGNNAYLRIQPYKSNLYELIVTNQPYDYKLEEALRVKNNATLEIG